MHIRVNINLALDINLGLDQCKPKGRWEVQEEQVQGALGGSQVTSCVNINLALDQCKPRCI
jgi:hypothetical protein